MSTIIRRLLAYLYIDGVPVLTSGTGIGIVSIRCSLGYDMEVSEASIEMTEAPSWAKPWSEISVAVGMTPDTTRVRFAGYLVQIDKALYPKAVTLICKGRLIKAQLSTAAVPDTEEEPGISMCNDGAGATDEDQVAHILDLVGLTADVAPRQIYGTGRLLGTYADDSFMWFDGESALAYIHKLDQICLGYRTYDGLGGTILRTLVRAQPSETPIATFVEGVDIFSANLSDTILEVKNRVHVTGYSYRGDTLKCTVQQSSEYIPAGTYITHQVSSPMIEKELALDPEAGISCEEVGRWQLGELNRRLWKISLTTPRDDYVAPGTTIAVISPNRLSVNNNLWVQHVEIAVSEEGEFSQVFTCIGRFGGGGPVTGIEYPPVAEYTFEVLESERVIVEGIAETLYTVQCTQTCIPVSAPIVSYTWSAPTGTPASGTGERFVVSFTSTAGATVTLTCTDAHANSGSIAKTVVVPAGGWPTRELFLAGTSHIEAFSRGTWRSFAKAFSHVVANGPQWGAGNDVLTSDDYLETAPTETSPFGATTVTSLFVDPANSQRVIAGSSDGRIAVSENGGSSWVIDPCESWGDSDPVLRVALDSSLPLRRYALTQNALYRTDNAGSTWVVQVAAQVGERLTDFCIGATRSMIAIDGGRLMVDGTGTVQTLPGGVTDVIAVTNHPGSDRFFAYDTDGSTFAHEAAGNTSLALLEPLPAGVTPQPRGLQSDQDLQGLLYIAGGAGGVYKSLDGCATAAGYKQLRVAGTDGAPASAVYTQVGRGAVSVPEGGDYRRIIIACGGRVFWTENIWETTPAWQENSTGLPAGGVIRNIKLDPFDWTRVYLFLENGGIWVNSAWRTGGTWTEFLSRADAMSICGGNNVDQTFIEGFAMSIARRNYMVVLVSNCKDWSLPNQARCAVWVNGGWTTEDGEPITGLIRTWSKNSIVLGQHNPFVAYAVWQDAGDGAHLVRCMGLEEKIQWGTGFDDGSFPENHGNGCVLVPYTHNPSDLRAIYTGGFVGTGKQPRRTEGGSWSDYPTMLYGPAEIQGDDDTKILSGFGGGRFSRDYGLTWEECGADLGTVLQVAAPREGYYFALTLNPAKEWGFVTSRSNSPWVWVPRFGGFPDGIGAVTAFTIDPGS